MNERNYSIDTVKAFCILGVVSIHTQPFCGTYLGTIINTIARVCVPLFFMFSGYFIYSKKSKKYVKNYTKNLIKVLILSISIYILYNISLMTISNLMNSKGIFTGIVEYLIKFKIIDIYYATGIVKYHLWYLSAMIIVIPILYLIISKNLLDIAIKYALGLNIVGVLLPVLISQSLWIKVRDAIFLGVFYCMLGAYINKHEIKIKERIMKIGKFKYIGIITFLFIISIVERFVYLVIFNGSGDYFISTIPLSIFIFGICLRNLGIGKNSIINKFGKETLIIYIIHPLIIECASLMLYKLNLDWILSTVIWQLVYTPIVLIISYLVCSIIQSTKITILKLSKTKSFQRLKVEV